MMETLQLQLQPQIDAWTAFDWQAKRQEAEATLQQTKEAQKASLAARKQLAETTKTFKRAFKAAEQASSNLTTNGGSYENVVNSVRAVENMSKEVKVTIKAYQEEIDNITRRCKSSESAYSTLAQSVLMGQQSDPSDVMTQMLKKMQEMAQEIEHQKRENQHLKQQSSFGVGGGSSPSSGGSSAALSKQEKEELISLRKEVAEYEVEFRSLKNQDITIRKLEARIAELQTSGQEELEDKVQKMTEQVTEEEGRRVTEALEREAALERKVQTLELQLKAERAGREATQAQFLEENEGVSHREAAWEAQRQILVDDSTRVREQLQAAVRERDELRLKVAALEGRKSGGGATNTSPPSSGGVSMTDLVNERQAYEAEVAELSETASLLRDELRIKEELLGDQKRTSQTKIDALEREIESLKSNLEDLESQLSSAPSQALVESMKRELRILKRLEYNADDVDDVDDAADRDPEIAGGAMSQEKDLETVLVAKLRRAESDLVTERMSRTDLREEVDALKKALRTAEKAKDDADKLVFSLEKDLELACATPVSPSRASRPTVPPIAEENPAALQSILDPNAPAPPLTPAAPPAPEDRSSPSMTSTEKAEDDHSVATIVMAQRDRLRARCESLEAERDSFKRELQGQVQASESLKADNTKLYEKVRYLQNYNKGPTSGPNRRPMGGAADRDLDLEALEQRYEASVDPFRQFSKAERQRKLNEMSPMERAVFIVAKTTLATKEMRTALFFYVLALHLLVFVTTYHWSHAKSGCHNVNNEHLAFLPHEQQTAKAAEAQPASTGT